MRYRVYMNFLDRLVSVAHVRSNCDWRTILESHDIAFQGKAVFVSGWCITGVDEHGNLVWSNIVRGGAFLEVEADWCYLDNEGVIRFWRSDGQSIE